MAEDNKAGNEPSILQAAGKTNSAQQNFDGLHVCDMRGTPSQDAQKGQTSHPPNPGAPRRALSQARPQRAKRRGVGFGTLSL